MTIKQCDGAVPPDAQEISQAMASVFQQAADSRGSDLLRYLLPVNCVYFENADVIINAFDDEMYELYHFVSDLKAMLHNQGILGDQQFIFAIRIKTLAYCHILEADFPLLVILNMLYATANKEPNWIFCKRGADDLPERDKKGKVKKCESLSKKIDLLKHVDKDQYIADCINRLWSADLRNAFSHSQYSVEKDGNFCMTKYFSGALGHTAADLQTKRVQRFSSKSIDEYYLGAEAYLNEFCNRYSKAIYPYKNGQPHNIGGGRYVSWNAAVKRFEPANV